MNKHLEGAHSFEAAQMARQIEAALATRLHGDSGPWHAALVSSQASHGGTLVFSVQSARTGRKVAAKVYRRRHLAEAELRAFQEACSGRAATAQCLFAAPRIGLAVSTWHEGKSFSDLFEGDGWQDAVAQAGLWLRGLHRARQGRIGIYHPMRFVVDLCDGANALPGAILPTERGKFTRALSATARTAAMSLPGVFTPVRLHGDFLPQNLIQTPQGTVAIDLLHTRVGSRHDDLASMTVNLAFRTEIGTLGRGACAEQARQVFLSSYGLKGRQAHARLRLAEQVELLKRWQHFANESFPHRQNGLAMVRIIQSIFHERGGGLRA